MKLITLTIIISLMSINLNNKLPELNSKVIAYVNSVMGKKVDRGECWDLAAGALAYSDAYFDRSSKKTLTTYGRKVNPDKEEVLAGDLMQFENVFLEWKDGSTFFSQNMAHHTAIVYLVNSAGDYEIAHQNTSMWGKKVGVSNFKLEHVKKGKVMIYRPIKEK